MGPQPNQPYRQSASPASTTSTPSPRYSNNHASSSAFSASANANEDWTKVSDLAERRRIQNRIAQRNYRKKLKKRLEDLERRANSASASPEPQTAELDMPRSSIEGPVRSVRPPLGRTTSEPLGHRSPEPGFSHHLSSHAHEDRAMFAQHFNRQQSQSPPVFAYSPYSNPENVSFPSHPHSPAYHSYPMPSPEMPLYGNYHPGEPSRERHIKQEHFDDGYEHYNASYGSWQGMEYHQSYLDSAPNTPPASDMYDSFDESGAPSPEPMWSMFPPTPDLVDDSPALGYFT